MTLTIENIYYTLEEFERAKEQAIRLFKKEHPTANVNNLLKISWTREGIPLFYMVFSEDDLLREGIVK